MPEDKQKSSFLQGLKKPLAAVVAASAISSGAAVMEAGADDSSAPSTPLARSFNIASEKVTSPGALALDRALKDNNSQFTMLGDTDHSNDQLPWFLSRDDTLQALQNHDVKKIFIEFQPSAQDLGDKVAAGTMTPQEFERAYEKRTSLGGSPSDYVNEGIVLRGEMIRNASKHGIGVVFADVKADRDMHAEQDRRAHGVMPDFSKPVEGGAMAASEKDAYGRHTELDNLGWNIKARAYSWSDGVLFPTYPQQVVNDVLASHAQPSDEMRTKIKADRAWEEDRVGGDADLEKLVRERAGSDKAVIFYGAEHGRVGCGDIAHRLGATRIDIYSDTTGVKANAQMIHMQNEELPDVALTIDKGQVFSRDDMKSLALPGSPQLPKDLTPQLCKPDKL